MACQTFQITFQTFQTTFQTFQTTFQTFQRTIEGLSDHVTIAQSKVRTLVSQSGSEDPWLSIGK